jgi:hypothetical protein
VKAVFSSVFSKKEEKECAGPPPAGDDPFSLRRFSDKKQRKELT